MVIITSYGLATAMLLLVMVCWGSWANTLKLAGRNWPFQLFYWDYSFGVLLLSLVLALTMGSLGSGGRSFLADLAQASPGSIGLALLGGVVFNCYNILLVSAIEIAGMAVAFPLAVGLALIIGVVANYVALPQGNPLLLFGGLGSITLALVCTARAYGNVPAQEGGGRSIGKGLLVSAVSGLFGGFFFRFVAAAMSPDFVKLEAGKLGPYAAVVLFALGLVLSNAVFVTYIMTNPLVGARTSYREYFAGRTYLHLVGLLGGLIWCVGISFSILASGTAGFAISYGLAQGCTMIAAVWGVFIWREFRTAKPGTSKWLTMMFCFYLLGLGLIIAAKKG